MAYPTLLLGDSFDHRANTTYKKWTSDDFTFTTGRVTNAVIPGIASYTLNRKSPLANSFDYVMMGAWRTSQTISADSAMVFLRGAFPSVTLHYNLDGTVTVRSDYFGAVLANSDKVGCHANVGAYYEFGCRHHASAGQVIVRANGEEIINVTGLNTGSSATGCMIQGTGGGTVTSFDDFYFAQNDSGSSLSFFNDVYVKAIFPTGNGAHSDWSPSSGSNYQTIDEYPPSLTDYNESSTLNAIDTFTFPALSYTLAAKAVQVTILASQVTDSQAREIKAVCRIGATDYLSDDYTTLVLGTTAYYTFAFPFNPATSGDWTIADINSAEFGYKLITAAAGAAKARIYQCCIEVIGTNTSKVRIYQAGLEVAGTNLSKVRIYQAGVELLEERITPECDCKENVIY